MALPHAQPQLQEHLGVKVMLCSVLVKRSVADSCDISAPGFCGVVSLLASLFLLSFPFSGVYQGFIHEQQQYVGLQLPEGCACCLGRNAIPVFKTLSWEL